MLLRNGVMKTTGLPDSRKGCVWVGSRAVAPRRTRPHPPGTLQQPLELFLENHTEPYKVGKGGLATSTPPSGGHFNY